MTSPHIPVLLNRVVDCLAPQPGDSYVDGTAGYGGHAAAILQHIGADGRATLIDRDATAIEALKQRFGDRAEVIQADFLSALQQLKERDEQPDMVLLDLGVSSPQLDNGERGFSFTKSGPMDMRMDVRHGQTALELVNNLAERELADLIYEYGEERRSRQVASALVKARPLLNDTKAIAEIVRRAVGKSGDINPATRTFQALRIAVNSELDQIEQALPIALEILKPGGRLAVISFHSLEDRIVKRFLQTEAKDCICPPEQPVCTCDHKAQLTITTKKPLTADEHELAINPRARSAKLRAAVKIKNQKEA